MENNQPEIRFRAGECSASIFAHDIQKDGKSFNVKRAVFQKRYKNADGEWRTTQGLNMNDIPRAIVVLQNAYEYMLAQRGELQGSGGR